MQRRATRQSRGANADEKAFMAWIKERGVCAACGNNSGVYVHHCEGSTYKRKVDGVTEILGHFFVIGLCQQCDDVVTHGSRKSFREKFGLQSNLWKSIADIYPNEIPERVYRGIMESGR